MLRLRLPFGPARGLSRRNTEKGRLRPIAGLGLTLGGLAAILYSALLGVTPALAHHPVISGTSSCLENGTWTATFTVGNSENDLGQETRFSGSGPAEYPGKAMRINAISATAGSLSGLAVNSVVSNNGSGSAVVSGISGSTTSVTLSVTGFWRYRPVGSSGDYTAVTDSQSGAVSRPVSGCTPSPTSTPTQTVTVTRTATPTATATFTPTATPPIFLFPNLIIDKVGPAIVTHGTSPLGAADYSILVGNVGSVPTTGTVLVTDFLPNGLTNVSLFGSGWACSISFIVGPTNGTAFSCFRSDPLAAGAFYPPISIDFVAPLNVCGSIFNVAHVSGGGDPGGDPDAQDSALTTVIGCSFFVTPVFTPQIVTVQVQRVIVQQPVAAGSVLRLPSAGQGPPVASKAWLAGIPAVAAGVALLFSARRLQRRR